jgi:hypothetical protein
MNRRLTRIALAVGVSLSVATGLTDTASASYHENLIREVHDGGGSTGDYVMLQAYAGGQNLVAGKHIVTYDGAGGVLSSYAIPNIVGNGANQATILISNGGVTDADFAANPGAGNDGLHLNVVNTGGTVCFADSSITVSLDCVAYFGSNAGTMFPSVPPASPFGTPLSLGGQDLDGKSIVRTIARGCASALDTADDTNNSSADFSIGPPLARNNAAPITETVCPPGNPTSPTNPAGNVRKRKCKKKQKRSAEVAKKKKCKKKKKRK